jgi:hypothetical protein
MRCSIALRRCCTGSERVGDVLAPSILAAPLPATCPDLGPARATHENMAAAEVTISVALPSGALAHEPVAVIERRLRLLWALDEIRAGRTTRAAAWLGLPLDEFLTLADAHGLPVFDYDPDDFKSELASLT